MTNTTITAAEMAQYIDHTLLKPDASREELIQVCKEAKEFNFATVCVNAIFQRNLALHAFRHR